MFLKRSRRVDLERWERQEPTPEQIEMAANGVVESSAAAGTFAHIARQQPQPVSCTVSCERVSCEVCCMLLC